jgi:hypothetical protein
MIPLGFRPERLSIQPVGPGTLRTASTLSYRGVYKGDTKFEIIVPSGFQCDGASVPKFAWAMLRSHWLDLLPFGVIHDYVYRKMATITLILPSGDLRRIDVPGRWWADKACCGALRTLGAGPAKDAWKVRGALVAGGWTAWQKKPVGWRV